MRTAYVPFSMTAVRTIVRKLGRTVTKQFNIKCLFTFSNISPDLFVISDFHAVSNVNNISCNFATIWSFQTTRSRPPSTRRPPTEPRLLLPSRPPSLSSSRAPPPSFCIHGNARHNRAKGASYYVSGMRDKQRWLCKEALGMI